VPYPVFLAPFHHNPGSGAAVGPVVAELMEWLELGLLVRGM
jgi:hypothetical protein